jgi:hypothetical protein
MENKDKKPEDVLYNTLGAAVPELEVEVSEEEAEVKDTHDTLSNRMKESPNLSDMQSVIRALSPILEDYLDVLKVARIYPEEFDRLRSLIIKDLMKLHPDWSLVKSAVIVTTALSIALDGEGRIDILRVAGAIKESEEAKALATGVKI